MEVKEFTCVSCPMGCGLKVEMEGKNILSITGNTCPRGANYARSEMTHPERMLTGTMFVSGGKNAVISVKSAKPVPKGRLLDCAAELKNITLTAPIKIGDVVIKDILGVGVEIIATSETKTS